MVALASAFVRVRPQVDKSEFIKEGDKAGEDAGKAFGDGFTRGSDGRLRDSRGKFVKDSEKVGTEAGTKTGRSFSKSLGKESSGSSGAFSKALSLISAKYTLLGGAALVATPGVLHLTAALAPAAGVVAGLPAVLGAAGAALSTFKVATSGVGKAINAGLTGTSQQAKKALDALPPSAQRFTKVIVGLKPKIDALRQSVAERFFRPLTDDIKPLADKYLPLLKTQMSNLAGPLGGLAEQFTQTARRSQVFAAVTSTFKNTRVAAILLRGSIDPLVKAFAAVVNSTAGKLPGLAQGFTNLAIKVGAFIQGAAKSGEISKFFQAGITTLKQLVGIVLNVGSVIQSVFTAANKSGSDLLTNLRLLTGEAAAFLKSVQGTAALDAIFSTLAQFGTALRTSLGAVLPALAQSLQVLGPAIAGLAGPLSQVVVAAAPLLPIFAGIAATVITKLTPAITVLSGYLAKHATVVKIVAGAVVAFLAVQKLANLAIGVQAAGGILAYIKSIQIVTTLTKIWTGVQAAFNLVMDANPIALVIIAIAALVAGIVYAYKHSEAFRNIVQAVWGAIKVAIGATVDWIVNVAWPAIKKAWDAIAAAGLWLWHNVIEPVWHGIQAAISFVVAAVKTYIAIIVAEFKFVAGIAMWLWHNIFEPVFNGIKKVVEIWWLAVQIVFKLFSDVVRVVVGAAVNFLKTVFTAVFNYIRDYVVIPWWNIIKAVFNAFRTYVVGPVLATVEFLRATFVRIFNAVANTVAGWYRNYIAPIFAAVRNAWNTLALGFSIIYNTKIKPVFDAFVGFIKGTVVKGFQTGVSLISKAWSAVQAAAKAPVTFVVNHVINPFINGLNKAASIVGVKDRVEPIKGFATGGQLPAYATGGKIAGAPSAVDNRLAPATIPGVGAVKLAGGEYVVNAQDTAKALPLLKWVNAGMKGGAAGISRYLGRPLAQYPGDGSEGWAFADGGLVGWTKDVWGALTNPGATIRKPFEALLNQIPGVGMIKDFLIGSAKKFLGSAIGWITGIGGPVSGSLNNVQRAVQARAFVQNQAGKPYIWASAGPRGYDCSGIVSAAYNILKGNNPYSHTFSTESLPGRWFDTRQKLGTLMAGWSHPGQSPASASVGHMAGQIAGMPFESTGSSGVRIGARARRFTQFANTGAARASGGLIDFPPVRLFDKGGLWPSGTLGANMSGRTEYVDPSGRGGSRTYQITINVAAGAHPVEVGRQAVIAIQAFENANGAAWRKP
jgi:phage-related protein